MDFGKAFTFFVNDDDWLKKLGIGSLFVLGGFFFVLPMIVLTGYETAVARQVMNGKDETLPAWDDFERIFIDALVVSLARFVYFLPMILLVCCSFLVVMLPAMGGEISESEMEALVLGPMMMIICVASLYGLLMMPVMPAVMIQYIQHDDWRACFQIGGIVAVIRDNLGQVLGIALGAIAASIAAQLVVMMSAVTIVGPFILMIVVPLWIKIVTGHLTGQVAASIAAPKAYEF